MRSLTRCVLCVALLALAGCGTSFRLPGLLGGSAGEVPPPTDYGNLGLWAGWLIGLGAVALVASFVFPLIPKSAPAASIAVGVGLLILKAALVAFMPYLKWAVLILGVWFAWQYVQRFRLDRIGKAKLKNGDPVTGGALCAVARGWTYERTWLGARHRELRKRLVERIQKPKRRAA